jgi:hypothetical protein
LGTGCGGEYLERTGNKRRRLEEGEKYDEEIVWSEEKGNRR